MIPEWKPIEESRGPKAVWVVAGAVLLVAAAGGYYYFNSQREPEIPPTVEALPAPDSVPAEPEIRNPVPRPDSAEVALPPLDESDGPLRAALVSLLGERSIEQFVVPEKLVRNLVVTVDNLPRSKVAAERRPLRRTQGDFAVDGQGDAATDASATDAGVPLTLSERNYARYTPFVAWVQSADARKLAQLYFDQYPLFQQAYEDLGYPGKYFNDRMVEVIDHLLVTPTPEGPVTLVQPRVFYEYADPALEQLSAGQKALIRMGPTNAAHLKEKMRELRALIAQGPQPKAAASPE